jgi:hypothetical protein
MGNNTTETEAAEKYISTAASPVAAAATSVAAAAPLEFKAVTCISRIRKVSLRALDEHAELILRIRAIRTVKICSKIYVIPRTRGSRAFLFRVIFSQQNPRNLVCQLVEPFM